MLPFRLFLRIVSVGTLTTFLLALRNTSSNFPGPSRSPGDDLRPSKHESATFRDFLIESSSESDKPWDHVYVINLPHRADRREHMAKLAAALDIEITFVDGVLTSNPVVPWILERLLEDQVRAETFAGDAEMLPQETRWGAKSDFTWRQHALRSLSPLPPAYELLAIPPSYQTLIYPLKHLSAETINPLGPTACTLAHLKVFELAMRNEDQSILVLEDDVDAEFELVSRFGEMKRGLDQRPEGWDMVYLGWIWSNEKAKLPVFNPHLRPANLPSGLHAYSLSLRGVRRLHARLTTSPSLFSRPIDHEIPRYAIQEANDEKKEDWVFKSWSAVPPLVLPGDGGLGTDIGGEGGTEWGGILSDSTWARIAAYEGNTMEVRTDEDVRAILAVSQGM